MYKIILFNLTLLKSVKIKKTDKVFLGNLKKSITNVRRFATMDLKIASALFEGVEDRYHGITVDSKVENCKIEEFSLKLDESLKSWIGTKKRGIWFKVAVEHADWVPILAKKGFDFHHANKGYVMMYHWLPKESCNVPTYAHTMLAVGAIVVNERSQILAVRDKYFYTPHWKLPGGLVEPGENLSSAAVREVKEETNIDSEFTSLISIRHAHGSMFNCSDMYIVVSLKALSDEIVKCPREIEDCKWMGIDEFLGHDEVTDLNKLFVQRYLEYRKEKMHIECQAGYHQIFKKDYWVYSAVHDKL